MKISNILIVGAMIITSASALASESKKSITELISKKEFTSYKHVGDFIEHSPKVTILVKSEPHDITAYGDDVVKSLTGSDCDRDGKMDDNSVCNAVYYKLWMSYAR